ncbi:hypothetical protein HY490_02465 [Candidatus Woesearchaeota archaeon]|nr:hypothetical protein [Candidatus Woesearchaeota archaeon]
MTLDHLIDTILRIERKHRKELMRHFPPTLQRAFAKLPFDARHALDAFHAANPDYLHGAGSNRVILRVTNDDKQTQTEMRQVALQCHYAQQLVNLFNEWKTHKRRRFNTAYLSSLREGQNLIQQSQRSISGGFTRIEALAGELAPDILKYWSYRNT